MYCSKCGQPAPPDAAFCTSCGNALKDPLQSSAHHVQQEQPKDKWQAQQPARTLQQGISPQGYYVPPAPPRQADHIMPVKKKKTGLIVGLALGGTALLAFIVVLLFVWPGLLKTAAPVAGIWYSENRGEVIRFGSGSSFDAHTYYGEFEGDYQYDKTKGNGHIEMSDQREFDFVVDENRLYVEGMGAFDRAGAGFDVNDFIDAAKLEFGEGGSSE